MILNVIVCSCAYVINLPPKSDQAERNVAGVRGGC